MNIKCHLTKMKMWQSDDKTKDSEFQIKAASRVSDVSSTKNVEYKEYIFKPNSNKDVESKVTSFWKHIKETKSMYPPKSDFFKRSEIVECLEKDEYQEEEGTESMESEKRIIKQKWSNTLSLFKNRRLDKVAAATVPKTCPLCNNEKFAPVLADENCKDLVLDYGK